MAENQENQEEQGIPMGQVAFDEYYLFFMLSLVISFMFYNLWGLLELLSLPVLAP